MSGPTSITPGQNPSRTTLWIGWVAIAVLAVLVRVPDLASRPFHTDEANNAYLLQEWLAGHFKYRAHDHHGPLLFQVAGAAMHGFGVRTVADMEAVPLRLVSVFCGVLLTLSPLLLLRAGQETTRQVAALFLALSAPFVYYNGLFLHESLLLVSVAAFVWSLWQVRESGLLRFSLLCGITCGLALGTKETAAPILGLFVLCALPGSRLTARGIVFHALVALAACGLTVTTLYSNFWSRPSDALGLFKAIGPQFSRGTGVEHAYPWYQYIEWHLLPSPLGPPLAGILFVAGGAAGLVLGWRDAFLRAIGLWALGLLIFFSALSYKTPWLALAWIFPLALLSAHAVGRLLDKNRRSGALACLLLAPFLLWETRDRCLVNSVEPGNAFAYSPSSRDLARLDADVATLMNASKSGDDTLIQVVARDYWPLPWTLRRHPRVGYWSDLPTLDPDAIVLLGPEYANARIAPPDTLKAYAIRPGALVFMRPPISR